MTITLVQSKHVLLQQDIVLMKTDLMAQAVETKWFVTQVHVNLKKRKNNLQILLVSLA